MPKREYIINYKSDNEIVRADIHLEYKEVNKDLFINDLKAFIDDSDVKEIDINIKLKEG